MSFMKTTNLTLQWHLPGFNELIAAQNKTQHDNWKSGTSITLWVNLLNCKFWLYVCGSIKVEYLPYIFSHIMPVCLKFMRHNAHIIKVCHIFISFMNFFQNVNFQILNFSTTLLHLSLRGGYPQIVWHLSSLSIHLQLNILEVIISVDCIMRWMLSLLCIIVHIIIKWYRTFQWDECCHYCVL